MTFWLIFCVLFVLALSLLFIWPLGRHPTLPRRKKILLSGIIFVVLVPGGLALYAWVGMPPMALL